jgi:hypothetical protein
MSERTDAGIRCFGVTADRPGGAADPAGLRKRTIMNVTWIEKGDFLSRVTNHLEPVESVLDIGCGILPQKYIRPMVHICCEPFTQYVEVLKEKTKTEFDRNYLILNASWSDALKFFPAKSVDSVFLMDVIEHIEKEEAVRLLKATEDLARRQVVVFTPLGFFPQRHPDGKDAWGLDGADWQEHKSGWQPEDFDDSWVVYACRDFHATNNLGEPLETPFGAIWAVKTFAKPGDEIPIARLKRRDASRIFHLTLDIDWNFLSNTTIRFMEGILRAKNSRIVREISRPFRRK